MRRADERADELDPFEDPEMEAEAARPAGGYRVAGDLEVRSKELEQELVQTKARLREMEREVFAARKIVRRRKAATGVSRGGVGATLGCVLALLLYASELITSPGILLGLVVLGFVFGAFVGMRWDTDDDFPAAPPPRMF